MCIHDIESSKDGVENHGNIRIYIGDKDFPKKMIHSRDG